MPKYFNRPQRSYVFTRVCDSVHRGGLPKCMLGYHPQEQTPLPLEQTPTHPHPTPRSRPPLGADPPPGSKPPPGSRPPPPAYGQWAAGTHPTGMHSFFLFVYTPMFNLFCLHNSLWRKYYFIFESYELVLITEVCHTQGNICSWMDKSYFWDQPSVLISPHRYFFKADPYD